MSDISSPLNRRFLDIMRVAECMPAMYQVDANDEWREIYSIDRGDLDGVKDPLEPDKAD